MSGLGAFIQGAMQGYQFADSMATRKQNREQSEDIHDWRRETQDRQREEWKRADKERSVLQAIGREAKESYEAGQAAQPHPEVEASQEGVVTRNAPQEGPSIDPEKVRQPVEVQTRMADNRAQPPRPDNPSRTWPDAAPSAPAAETSARRAPRPRGIIEPIRDAAPSQPDAAPMQEWANQFEQIATGLQLAPNIVEGARVADRAASELMRGINSETGAPLTEDEIADRREAVGAAEFQLRRQLNAAQPLEKGPANITPRYDPNTPTPHGKVLLRQMKQRLEKTRHLLSTPNPVTTGATPDTQMASATAPARMGQQQARMTPPGQDQAPARPGGAGRPPNMAVAGARSPMPGVGPADGTPIARTEPGNPPQPQDAEKAAEIEQLHETAATQPPDKGGSPSVAVATQTAPKTGRGILGKDDPVKATKAQRDRAAKSFLDHYAETAVPKIVEYYATQGNIEKAQAFETWAKSREAQGQLEAWSKAVHAASIGDDDAFIDHMVDTYNAFDDGYTVDREGSGFTRDKDGNITGGQLTFVNSKTGEKFVKTYEDQADIISESIYALSPEQVFEKLWSQVAQASEIAAEQRKFEREIIKERVKSGLKGPGNAVKDIAAAKKFLAESMMPGKWDELSPEEQNQRAIDWIRSNQQAGAELSQPAAPPLYTGE